MQKTDRVTDEMVGYVLRYGGMCRDCADEDGTCPTSGQPCDTDQRRAVVKHTIAALAYGIKHGFIANPFTAALSSAEEKAVDTAPCAHVIGLTRYEPITNCSEPDMAEHPNGDWVRLDDVCKGLRANPIEWDGDQAECYGMHEFGYYLIIRRPSGFSLSTFTNKGGMRPMGFHKALDDAETEAQADYQRRILSCLNPSPQPREPARSALVDVPAVEEPAASYFARQIEWSRETFGPALRTKGVIDHIRKELAEIECEPHDLSEWIDVVILAMDGFWRHGGKAEDLMPALLAKQRKNMARVWPDWRTMSEDSAIEHDRSHDAHPPRSSLQSEEGEIDTAAIEAGAKILAKWISYAWDGLPDRDISDEFPDWSRNGIGALGMQGGKPALRKVSAAILALSTPPSPYGGDNGGGSATGTSGGGE